MKEATFKLLSVEVIDKWQIACFVHKNYAFHFIPFLLCKLLSCVKKCQSAVHHLVFSDLGEPRHLVHHHWLDSPWWTLAFLRSFAHSSLLRAAFFHLLTPRICVSWATPFSHRNFGLPTLLVPSGLVLNIFWRVLSSLIRIRCPAHASLLTLMWTTMSESLNISYSS